MKKVLKVIGIIAAVAGAIFGVYVIVKKYVTAKKQLSAMTLKIMRRQLRFRNRCVNKNVL